MYSKFSGKFVSDCCSVSHANSIFPQAVEYCVELTDGYAARGLCHVLEVSININPTFTRNLKCCRDELSRI